MKVNHKSLKLGVAFALVSTVGITSAEIIKQELSKPIVAVEETTTTENPEKIKYKKEVQEFSKTMRPVVAKYGVTDEKLDELVNKWVEKGKYSGYTEEFNEESKKVFIETVIDSTAYNFILNSLDKAIDIVQKANYFDSTQKEKWLSEMKEYKADFKDGYTEDYPFHTDPYSRTRYYQDDRKDLLTNYPIILENTIQDVRERRIYRNTAKLYNHEIESIIGYAEMKEEQEINQDSSLSEQQKKQLLEKIDNILEVKYALGDNVVPFETINDIILEIRKVHTNANGSEYEEPFSKEKVKKYIDRIVQEKTEFKVKELTLDAKTQFEEYGNSQKTKLLEEGISEEDFNNILKSSFEKASKNARYYYRLNRETELNYILRNGKNELQNEVESLKAKSKVKEALNSYVNSKKQELENSGITDEKINEIITKLIGNLNYNKRYDQKFDEKVEELISEYKKFFDGNIKIYLTPLKIKNSLKESYKLYIQELKKYGFNDSLNNSLINEIVEFIDKNLRYGENSEQYYERLLNVAKSEYQEKVLEEVIKIKVSKFREEQEKLILADNRYTDVEKEKVIFEIRMNLGAPVIHFLRNKLNNNAKEFDKLSLTQKIEKMLSLVNDNTQNTHFTAPMNKNKYTVNNVALNEKLEINQDSSLSLSEKLALQLKVDELAEKVIKKIETLNLIGVNREGIPRSMTTEELAVFIEQIQNIHNAKVVNNTNEVFKPKEEKIEKPLLEKTAPTQPVDNGGTITEKPSVLPELKPVQPTETTSTIELKPVASKEKEEKTTEVVSNKVETTKENEETTKEVVSRNKWEKKGNHWYYVDNDGKAVSKQWIESYYIKADKTMAENEWIYDAKYNSWFYLDENGHYVENTWKDQYYLKSGGYMAKNEWIFDSSYNSWYYLNEDGSYARNQWIQSNGKWYYVLSNGKMAKNTVIDGYQLNENGEWV